MSTVTRRRRIGRMEQVVRAVVLSSPWGITCREFEREANLGHGAASAALSRAHEKGLIVRLAKRRDGFSIYTLPDTATRTGQRTVKHGSRTKPETVSWTRVKQVVDEWNLWRVDRVGALEVPILRVPDSEARALTDLLVNHLGGWEP